MWYNMGGVHCLLITAPFLTADNCASVKKNATSCSELQQNSLGAHTVQIELNYVSIQHWLHQWKKSKQTIKSKIVLIFCYETFMFQKMTNDDNVFAIVRREISSNYNSFTECSHYFPMLRRTFGDDPYQSWYKTELSEQTHNLPLLLGKWGKFPTTINPILSM